jgi:hypothetical protein
MCESWRSLVANGRLCISAWNMWLYTLSKLKWEVYEVLALKVARNMKHLQTTQIHSLWGRKDCQSTWFDSWAWTVLDSKKVGMFELCSYLLTLRESRWNDCTGFVCAGQTRKFGKIQRLKNVLYSQVRPTRFPLLAGLTHFIKVRDQHFHLDPYEESTSSIFAFPQNLETALPKDCKY